VRGLLVTVACLVAAPAVVFGWAHSHRAGNLSVAGAQDALDAHGVSYLASSQGSSSLHATTPAQRRVTRAVRGVIIAGRRGIRWLSSS
jgi:hypothetical protein